MDQENFAFHTLNPAAEWIYSKKLRFKSQDFSKTLFAIQTVEGS